ncbi:hypothetical protein CC2G_004475 [Coprinopsis cinerea AmutBmut pab1-1]|nr:hypothetical protein CC2G_004475 [Coprinopsis cinerea AmutBmut pab1-1]
MSKAKARGAKRTGAGRARREDGLGEDNLDNPAVAGEKVVGERAKVVGNKQASPGIGDIPAEAPPSFDTAALAQEYAVGGSSSTGAAGDRPTELFPIFDTAVLGEEYEVGSSPPKPPEATEVPAASTSEYNTADLAADYHVGESQPKSQTDPSAATLGQTPDEMNEETKKLAMEYFDLDSDTAAFPLTTEPSAHDQSTKELAMDYFVEPSVASSDGDKDGGGNSDVTLVGIRTRCRESLLDCYLQERLAVQGLLDCRRRITDYIALLTKELECMEEGVHE